MPRLLTDAQVQDFHRDGIAFPISVLSDEEAAKYLALSNDLEQQLGGKPKPVELAQMHFHFRWAYNLAMHPKVLDAVEDVLGPNVLAWALSLFPKHPHDPSYISWHQDGMYWGLDSTQVATAWIALSSSTVENGCMRVVAGSQRDRYVPHVETFAEGNLLSRGQEVAVEVNDDEATDVVLKAGELSLHDVRIIHGSNANQSDEKRVGFAVRYVTPEVAQVGQRPKAVLARGRDDHHHYELVGPPVEKSLPEALAAMKASADAHLDSVMQKKV